MVAQQGRVGKGKSWGKEGGKRFEKKEGLFAFCVTVSFTSSFPFSIHHATTLLPTLLLTTPSHTTQSHTACHTSTPVCCPLSFFVCDCQCTPSTPNQITQHHATMQSPHTAQPTDDLPPHCPRPLFPPQSKTVEGTCSVGYRLRDSLTWARSLPDRSEDCADGWVRTNLADLLLSKDKRVLHLECDLLLRGCFEFPCTTLSPRLPTIKTFPLHPSQLHSFNSHRPKAIAR